MLIQNLVVMPEGDIFYDITLIYRSLYRSILTKTS